MKLGGGVPFISDADFNGAMDEAGVRNRTTEAVLADYQDARIDGLEAALGDPRHDGGRWRSSPAGGSRATQPGRAPPESEAAGRLAARRRASALRRLSPAPRRRARRPPRSAPPRARCRSARCRRAAFLTTSACFPIIASVPVVAFVLRPIRFDQSRRNAISTARGRSAATRTMMLAGESEDEDAEVDPEQEDHARGSRSLRSAAITTAATSAAPSTLRSLCFGLGFGLCFPWSSRAAAVT